MQVAYAEAKNDWPLWSAQDSVVRFLEALVNDDIDLARTMLDPDVTFANVSMRTLRGRARVMQMIERLARSSVHFDVTLHHVSACGRVVLVERTDALTWRGMCMRFWVCAHFEVRERRIVVWRDYFDWFIVTKSVLGAILGFGRRSE